MDVAVDVDVNVGCMGEGLVQVLSSARLCGGGVITRGLHLRSCFTCAQELQQVLNHSPEDRDTLMALGRLYLQLGKDVEASGVLKKVTDQYKDNEEAWLLYGYSSRHDSEFALKCMANAIRAAKTRDHEVIYSLH